MLYILSILDGRNIRNTSPQTPASTMTCRVIHFSQTLYKTRHCNPHGFLAGLLNCIGIENELVSVCYHFVLPQADSRGDGDWQREQLQTDGQVDTQIRAELEESQKQLKCAHETQQEQKSKIQSLR